MSGDFPLAAERLVKRVWSFDLISLFLDDRCSVKSSLPLNWIDGENVTALKLVPVIAVPENATHYQHPFRVAYPGQVV